MARRRSSRWRRPRGWCLCRAIDATRGGPRPGGRASCSWPRLDAGARRVILGIGGSATNDGGAGLGQALGYRLLDASGRELEPGGGALAGLDRIDASGRDPRLVGVEVAVACDVDNPLCGPRGASAVYGPQKGATPERVAALDRNLDRFATIVARDLGVEVRDIPGAGAAGGLGGGLVAFASGRLEPGIALVIDAVGLARRLEGADLCLTGEGGARRLERLRQDGRRRCPPRPRSRLPDPRPRRHDRPRRRGRPRRRHRCVFQLCPGPIALDDAIDRGAGLLEAVTAQAVRAFLAGRRRVGPISVCD